MSKGKNKPKGRVALPVKTERRGFLKLGLGGAGALAVAGIAGYKAGWFDSSSRTTPSSLSSNAGASPAVINSLAPISLPLDYPNALRASDEIVSHYARELKNPSVLIHAVRAFGKNFTLTDGTKAVDLLCSKYAAEKEVNGKRYVYFPREAEVHDNSFLKTMLEAGVSSDQPISVGSNSYKVLDLGESARALFRCDPQNFSRYDSTLIHQHLPWGLIAFSILVPPSQSSWKNAYGETIDLPQVIDRGLAVFEGVCSGVRDAVARGDMESLKFREDIAKYSCFGMHMAYGFFSCLNHGYRNNNLPARLNQLLDTVIYRLEGDRLANAREAEAVRDLGPEWLSRLAVGDEKNEKNVKTKGAPPPNTIEVMRDRKQIQLIGHALEAINYGLLHKLFTLTPNQKKRVLDGERALYEYLVKLRATDLGPFNNWYSKFVSDMVIAMAHASRALKLLTPDNPDTAA
jgi:hypothetical protein